MEDLGAANAQSGGLHGDEGGKGGRGRREEGGRGEGVGGQRKVVW